MGIGLLLWIIICLYYKIVSCKKTKTKMSEEEIIKGLMLKVKDENINVMALSKRIGFKNYKKFEKAYYEALKIKALNQNKDE